MKSSAKKKPSPKKKSTGKSSSKSGSTGRRAGYIATIIFMIAFLYILQNLREWGVNFLNADFSNALIYIQLSIYATIAANVLFIFYDNRWFRHLAQAVNNVFSALSIIMLYVIFPFILDETWTKWLKIGLLVIFGLTVIAILVELFKGIRDLTTDPEKE